MTDKVRTNQQTEETPPAENAESKPATEVSVDREFDPAVYLPPFGPGLVWFVLRVASNKENYVRVTVLR